MTARIFAFTSAASVTSHSMGASLKAWLGRLPPSLAQFIIAHGAAEALRAQLTTDGQPRRPAVQARAAIEASYGHQH